MKKFPKVFVIVLNYNGADVLRKCLLSLFLARYPNLEVVVVDNNSLDGSLEVARKVFPRAHYIKNEENLGFSAGNNVGIRFALDRGADYVLLLNNDTEVKPDFLEKIVELGESNEKIGILSPLIREGKTDRVWFSGGRINWLRMRSSHLRDSLKEDFFNSDFMTGCAMAVKKDVFSRIGLLDEDFFLYWEDADFSVRAKREGFLLAVSFQSQIYHLEKSEETNDNKIYWLVLSGLLFFQKNSPFWLRPWYFIFIFLRKIKNKNDLRKDFSKKSRTVEKAYQDFKTYA